MKIVEILESAKVGSIINDKRILSVLKRKGLIYDYSWWGYLEWNDEQKYFNNGMMDIEYKGYRFDYVYLDGCFNAYLRLCEKHGNSNKEVKPRMCLWGQIL